MANFTKTFKKFLRSSQKMRTAVLCFFILSVISVSGKTTVVDVIASSENHTTLEAAITAAGLVDALSGDGPFTVFAPTDAAFSALPAGTLDALLADPGGQLTDILKYHVVSGKVLSTDLSDGMMAGTLFGKDVKVTINADGVFINDAKVTVADIMADNGVVHVIDAVLIPKTTVVDVIAKSESHTTLEAAITASGLVDALSGDGPFTIFAPTDAAFSALPAGTLDALLADPGGQLTDILKYHVVSGKVLSTDLSDGMMAGTLFGKDVKVTINADGVFINDARVTVADIMADNGVVHVIDAVLIPQTTTSNTDKINGEKKFRIYPNPASENLTIDIGPNIDLNSGTIIRIARIDGRILKELSVAKSNISIDLSNLSAGMYLVIMKQNNQVQTEKLIVQ